MRKLILFLLLFIFLFSGLSFAAEYEITKIIDLGPAGGLQIKPVKWSHDGTKLSFFRNGSLYISDTLGNSSEIAHFELYPFRYEWLSNYEIVVHFRGHPMDTARFNCLILIDLKFNTIDTLARYTNVKYQVDRDIHEAFKGPWLTVEGNLYYLINTIRSSRKPRDRRRHLRPAIFPESWYRINEHLTNDSANHILAWGDDGLYKLNTIFSDSVLIAPKPYKHMPPKPPLLSPDHKYYIHGGTMYSFVDSTYIVLDTIVTKYVSDSCGVGFWDYSFTSVPNEVIFTLLCSIPVTSHKENTYYSICTYNYVTGAFNEIDKMIDKDTCLYPAVTPDGRKIAFLSGSNAYIIYRKFIDEN